jgi:SNF2 family DNA or RNA helicase
MGLGKTLQTIGLILSNPPGKGAARCTLIVAPVTVMSNWKIQIEKFVKPGQLNVAIYHGANREQELKKVKRNELDILIASYNTLVSDHKQHEEVCDISNTITVDLSRISHFGIFAFLYNADD